MKKTGKQAFLERISRWPFGALLVFGIKQAWAAIFGGVLLLAIIITSYVDLPWLSRYDWLFLIAVLTQLVLLATKLERPREVITILVFHLVGLAMEVFKTSTMIGSWTYPEESFFRVAAVPLFSGFMYAAVGSYIARSWRVMEMDFSNYPKRIYTVLLAVAIYINFFSHHFVPDLRLVLFAATALIYKNTWASYKLVKKTYRMPLLLGFFLIAIFIWLAENIGTFTKAWLYPDQIHGWLPVSPHKIGAWFLLMIISFIMIDLLHYYRKNQEKRINKKSLQ